jgi:hypothetical protein
MYWKIIINTEPYLFFKVYRTENFILASNYIKELIASSKNYDFLLKTTTDSLNKTTFDTLTINSNALEVLASTLELYTVLAM